MKNRTEHNGLSFKQPKTSKQAHAKTIKYKERDCMNK